MATQSRMIGDMMTKRWLKGSALPASPTTTPEDLPGQDLIDQTESVIESQLAGEIPEDVQAEVERISAEQSLATGIGTGQKSRALTARDLGLTSFDIQQKGIEGATSLSQVQNQRNSLTEEMREWDDRFMLEARGVDLESGKLALAGLELVTDTQIETMRLANELIIANSQTEIAGVQENVDTLIGTPDGQGGFFEPTQNALIDLIKKYL